MTCWARVGQDMCPWPCDSGSGAASKWHGRLWLTMLAWGILISSWPRTYRKYEPCTPEAGDRVLIEYYPGNPNRNRINPQQAIPIDGLPRRVTVSSQGQLHAGCSGFSMLIMLTPLIVLGIAATRAIM